MGKILIWRYGLISGNLLFLIPYGAYVKEKSDVGGKYYFFS